MFLYYVHTFLINFVHTKYNIIIILYHTYFLERFCSTRETRGTPTSTTPVRRDQTAASPGQHQQ